jgi:hypothetical protein
MQRLVTRAQGILRSFWGLGPAQFTVEDNIAPVFDVDQLMRGPQDATILFQSLAAVAPGAQGLINHTMPTAGNWQLLAFAWDTTGPATSGTFHVSVYAQLSGNLWARSGNFALYDTSLAISRPVPASIARGGRFLDKPVLLVRDRGANSDVVSFDFTNDAGAVGNMTLNSYLLLRQSEPVLGQ